MISLDPPFAGNFRLPLSHLLLNIDGALDGLDNAGKLGQEPVAHELHDTTFALRDFRLHQLSAEGLEALKFSALVVAHETRKADHIGSQICG